MPTNVPRWAYISAGVLVLLAVAALWNRQRNQLVDARRAAEAAELRYKGQIVTAQESAGAFKADVARLLAENAELTKAYAEARTAAPDAQPIHAETLSTGPVVVAANPRPGQVQIAPTSPAEGKGPSSAAGDRVPGGQSSGPACVLAAGDQGSIEVQEIALQTKAGNVLVVGTAAAWRESPLPRSKLFGGKFESSLSDVSGLAPRADPRWGAGGAGICATGHGCSAGPAALLPPLRFDIFGFRVQIESVLGLTFGPQGMGALGVAAGRF